MLLSREALRVTPLIGTLRGYTKSHHSVLTGITQYVTMNSYYQSFILGEAGDDLSAISLVDPSAHPSSEGNDVQRKEYKSTVPPFIGVIKPSVPGSDTSFSHSIK